MSNIITGLKNLLEGAAGDADNLIASGQFQHIQSPVEEAKLRASGRPRPFNIREPELATGSDELGDMTARTKMRGAHELQVLIAYPTKSHDELTLLGEMLDDETSLRRVLEYEKNVALTSGWTGCTVTGSGVRDVDGEGKNAPPKLKLLVLTLFVSHRDTRIS